MADLRDGVLDVLRRAPATLNEMRNDLGVHGHRGAQLRNAIQSHRRGGRVRCGVTVPYTKWHLTDGCPCSVCKAKRP